MSTLRREGAEATDDLVESGQRLYNERLRELLEPAHLGRYVAIDPVSVRYFVADTGTEALLDARRALPRSPVLLGARWAPRRQYPNGHGRRVG